MSSLVGLVIQQHKKMEADNALTTGPIDLQYASYVRT